MIQDLEQLIPGYDLWQLLIEFIILWLCVFIIFRFLKGTRGAGIIKGFALLLVVVTVAIRVLSSGTDAFDRLSFIYERFLGLVAVLLIVVFQPELRQAMIRLGHAWTWRTARGKVAGVIDAVSDAVSFLSKSQFGALIAIERATKLGGLVETGVSLDAEVGDRLLESIFWPNSPLHDLGVVIRGDRIVAASVQFPLAEEGVLPPNMGSRHRAAVGLSLESDCVVVIVSEENGAVSIADRGELKYDIKRETFRYALAECLSAPAAERTAPEAVADDATTPTVQEAPKS